MLLISSPNSVSNGRSSLKLLSGNNSPHISKLPNFLSKASYAATQHAASNDASFSDAIVESFTDKISLEIAATIAEKLPGRVLQHIQRMLNSPSHKELEILQQATQQQLQLLPGVEGKYLAALPQSK